MAKENHNPPDSAHEHDHEHTDATPGVLGKFIVYFLGSVVLIILFSGGVYRALMRYVEGSQPTITPASAVMRGKPAGPLLEPEPSHDVMPRQDLLDVRAREQKLIGPHAWAWVDADHKFARIPLADATENAVENGLPVSLPATQPGALPSMPPASAVHGPGGVP